MSAPGGSGATVPVVRRARTSPGDARALRKLAESNRLVGWREWLALPQLGIPCIKAKVDTGARTSALHVYDLELRERHGHEVVRFRPPIGDGPGEKRVEVALRDVRDVKSSIGQAERRYVISTTFVLGVSTFVAELSLTSREDMVFNMLLGRSALRIRGLLVHPRRFFVQGLPRISG